MIGRGPRFRRGDEGMTVMELSVAMMLASVLLLAVGAMTTSTLRATRITTVKISTAADARVAMEAMTRTLRVGAQPAGEPAALTVAKADQVTFYALINHTDTADPRPTRVEYYRDAATNCLMEAQTPARVLAVPGPTGSLYAWDTGRVAKCVVRTADPVSLSDPWFLYYVSGSTATPLTMTASGLGSSDRARVQSIEVRLTVTDPNNPTVAGIVNNVRVTLANVAYADGGEA